MSQQQQRDAYWKANLRIMAFCLVIWFIVSFGFGVILAEPLDNFSLFGYPLGFWFAQQGSMLVFLVLIFFYAIRMNSIDKKFGVDEQ